MRKDAGVDGDAQRLGQMSWLLFLKIFDAQEEELEFEQQTTVNLSPINIVGVAGQRITKG